jgi:hypothetical protein
MSSLLSPIQSLRAPDYRPQADRAATASPDQLAQQMPSLMPAVTAQVVAPGDKAQDVRDTLRDREREPREQARQDRRRRDDGRGALMDEEL